MDINVLGFIRTLVANSHALIWANASLSEKQKNAITPCKFNIQNMKRVFLIVILLLANTISYSQNLSINELFALSNKQNWDEVNEYLLKKGWEYYESSKGDDTHYNTITWSYEKENYSDIEKQVRNYDTQLERSEQVIASVPNESTCEPFQNFKTVAYSGKYSL